jgi:hypothetical protein
MKQSASSFRVRQSLKFEKTGGNQRVLNGYLFFFPDNVGEMELLTPSVAVLHQVQHNDGIGKWRSNTD